MKHFVPLAAVLFAGLVYWLTPLTAQQQTEQQQSNQNAQQRAAAAVKLGEPTPFTSKDGKIKGWKVKMPGGRPLATPAVVDGKVFVGGGFGSHEFYAVDAVTGKTAWQYQTKDDGPTAAVVAEGYVAFNTESCELEILALNGKPVWKKWLGDPLMSMPAIANGKIYMAYPDSKGDRQHYLACFELKTGKEFWKKPIAGEIITAPVVADEKVYLATLEGSLYCFGQHDGELAWKEKKNATSSPMVWKGGCYFSRRQEVTVQKNGKATKEQTEQVANRGVGARATVKDLEATKITAHYLDFGKRQAGSPQEKSLQNQDAGVGIGGAKGDAKISQAMGNLGQGSVCGVWSYQGSRPFVYKDCLYSAMGDTVKCVDPKTEKILWKRPVSEKKDKEEVLDSTVTPPALANDKVFVGTTKGEVLCLSSQSGELLWKVSVGEPIQFQPAVVKGRVYVATSAGSVFCLETGDARDDGWSMWGGNAAHNGTVK